MKDRRLERAKEASILDVAKRCGAVLKKVTPTEYAGPCPACGGTDRFSVNISKKIYSCRGDNSGGDVVKLVQHARGLDFSAALEFITGEAQAKPRRQMSPQTSPHLGGQDPPPWTEAPGGPGEPKEAAGGDQPAFDPDEAARAEALRKPPKAIYSYIDEGGVEVYQKLRFEWTRPSDGGREKTFRQRRKARQGEQGRDGWVWKLPGAGERVPYRLQELIEAVGAGERVFICEGEKDADTLAAWGLCGTSTDMGAGHWPEELNQFFRGADVVILQDHDPQTVDKNGKPKFHKDGRPVIPGKDHTQAIGKALLPYAKRIRVLEFPELPLKGDVTDWRDDFGGTAEKLFDRVAAEAKPWAKEKWRSRFGGGFAHEFMQKPPERDWMLKGAILARTFILAVGPPGCGKSFLTLDFSMSGALLAADPKRSLDSWFNRKIKPTGVVYVAGEGQEDFRIRMHAWFDARGLPRDFRLPFFLIPTALDLRSSEATIEGLIEEIALVDETCREDFSVGVGLVVIDTVNKALAGGDDSKAEHVGPFIRNCIAIREKCGATVIGVHHTPKAVGRTDPRGHSSLRGDNDGEIFISPAEGGAPNDWRITRNKSGPIGARHEFRLRQIELGKDADGDPVTSCAVEPGAIEPAAQEIEMRDRADAVKMGKPNVTPDGRAIIPTGQTLALRALNNLVESEGEVSPIGSRVPHGRKAVKQASWTKEIIRTMPGEDKESKAFIERSRKWRERCATYFLNRGIIGIDGEWVWRTAKLVAGVDRRPETPDPTPDGGGEKGGADLLGLIDSAPELPASNVIPFDR